MTKLLSALVGVSMFGLVGVASAAEPLTDTQLDSVNAGFLNSNVLNIGAVGSGGVAGVGCAASACIGSISLL